MHSALRSLRQIFSQVSHDHIATSKRSKLTKRRPSRDHATVTTASRIGRILGGASAAWRSQTRTLLSAEPNATCLPLGDQARSRMGSLLHSRCASSRCAGSVTPSKSQTHHLLPALPINAFPSGDQDSARIASSLGERSRLWYSGAVARQRLTIPSV